MKTHVIVISGITGGGKSTLIEALGLRLDDVKVISFDDYSIDALPSAPPIDSRLKKQLLYMIFLSC